MPLKTIPAPQQWDPDNPNPHHLPQPPVRDDGTPFRYEIVFDDDRGRRTRGYADTPAELVCAICGPDYEDLDSEQRDIQRAVATIELAGQLQIQLVAANPDLYNALSAEEQAAVDHQRSEPCPVTSWASELPLVLSDIHYRPHTDAAPVHSTLDDVANPPNIIWLRAGGPGDHWTFLTSLANAGVIGLGARA